MVEWLSGVAHLLLEDLPVQLLLMSLQLSLSTVFHLGLSCSSDVLVTVLVLYLELLRF